MYTACVNKLFIFPWLVCLFIKKPQLKTYVGLEVNFCLTYNVYIQVEGSENKQENKWCKISMMNIIKAKTAMDKVKQARKTFSKIITIGKGGQN